jgi:type IV pilus assembly protein PilX
MNVIASMQSGLHKQRGASLVIALMFLIVLTIVGLVSVRTSTFQERMAGNNRDRAVAFEAAEATLRDAERDILANITTASAFNTTCNDGLCFPSTTATQVWNGAVWSGASSRVYGARSGAGAYPLTLSQAPRYIIEQLPEIAGGIGNSANANSGSSTTNDGFAYRITTRAWGRRPTTQVTLQSVFVKN